MNFGLLLKMWAKVQVKNICQNASGKNSQKHPDHAKQPATDERKTASKTAKAIGDLIGNNNADKITKV